MATINRVRCTWSNFTGAPGVSTFYTSASRVDMTPIRSFFQALTLYLAASVQVQVANAGDQINDATGEINGVWSGPVQSIVSAANSGSYSSASGGLVSWIANGIVAGRRPVGKTFLVPLQSSAYTASGGLSSTFTTAALTAATNLAAAMNPDLLVWSRPFTPNPNAVPPDTRPARPGSSHPVALVKIPSIPTVLRSRRV